MCTQTLPRAVEEAFDRADARAVLPRDVGKRINVEIAGEEDAALARRERAQVALDALGEQPRVQRFVRLAADRVAQLFKGEKIFPRAALLRAVAAIAVDGALPRQTAEKSRKHRRALRRNGVPRFQIGVRAHLLAGKLVEENALRELQEPRSVFFVGLADGILIARKIQRDDLLVGGYLLVSGQKLALRANRREAALLLLSGMAMGVNWILLFEAYRYTTVSVATLSYYFAPVLVTAACPLLFHERLTGKQIVCFVMSTLGLVLVIGVGGLRGGADVRGVLFGLGAATFYAAVILLNKFIRSVAGIQRTFLQFLAAIVILIPYVAATGGVSLGTLGARGWVCLLIVGFFHTGVTYCLYFSALRELPGQEVALLSYMDPLVAVIVSVTVLGEPVTAPQLAGGALILGFTLWNELPEKK